MARDRTVRKVEKVMKRLRDATPEEAPVEEVQEEADIENSTNTTAMRKF
jgi:hypothetical protein